VRARRPETGFGFLQGFAMKVYGPIFEHGAAFMNMGDGNYYGHNALVRVAAFADDACLPELPGRAPRGGLILSHDFIEAAFLRRAGWRVWMAPELDGSYEECPPNLIAFAKRDRRWCQGNLQHLRILFARGLHPMSRFHLGWGALAYCVAILWLIFLALGAGVIAEREFGSHDYFDANRRLFPIWPVFDLEQATLLLIATIALLLLPRALAVVHHVFARRRWHSPIRTGQTLGLFALEVAHSTLTAPVLMICHLRFIFAFAVGRAVSWSPKESEDGSLSAGASL
jgi:membrane glycosyltransferase